MKKFLCYDTNDAASGKINVSTNGILSPNATIPSTNGSSYQHLVTGYYEKYHNETIQRYGL